MKRAEAKREVCNWAAVVIESALDVGADFPRVAMDRTERSANDARLIDQCLEELLIELRRRGWKRPTRSARC